MAKVEGTETLSLPRAEVWRRLNDPDILAESIPGCSGFEPIGQDKFQTTIAVAVGPVRGVYAGTVSYLDVEPPQRCTITVDGRGDKGTIQGEGAITLGESGAATEVSYTGTFKLTGPVAGVGQRLAPGVSRRMIVETLHNLERAPGQGDARRSDYSQADTDAASEPPIVNDIPAAQRESTHSAPPIGGNRLAADFRPIALPPWGMFALGFATGVV